ncbi:hypothetical protein J3458_014481 [Metarhizium acridum]|uniref:uncharacterized protein n=1 Tax=Metarhizium acridum TaxID=92637 RepID=UPI001C6C685C|nr:hypothetical protein J3458_014481 [Metarhizium acridum]
MSGKDEIHFKCTIQGLHGEDPLRQDLDLTEKKSVPRRVFAAKIRSKYGVPGEITLHRSVRGKSGLVPGQEIRDDNLTLESNETIFVLYNKEVVVIAGGAGTGSEVVSRNSTLALAEGGVGEGGRMDAHGNAMGGNGFGGDAYGQDVEGEAGKGYGGPVSLSIPDVNMTSGVGVGGDLVFRDPATAPRSSRIVVKK